MHFTTFPPSINYPTIKNLNREDIHFNLTIMCCPIFPPSTNDGVWHYNLNCPLRQYIAGIGLSWKAKGHRRSPFHRWVKCRPLPDNLRYLGRNCNYHETTLWAHDQFRQVDLFNRSEYIHYIDSDFYHGKINWIIHLCSFECK